MGYIARTKNIEEYKRHLSSVDPTMGILIENYGIPSFKLQDNYFQSLVSSIIGQQVSVKAAQTINERFRNLFPDGNFPSPQQVLSLPSLRLREAGLSPQKVSYVQALAHELASGSLTLQGLDEMSDEEVIIELTRVKGIGRWTAEMFLMFSMGREDVFSFGDKGLLNALEYHYNLGETHTKNNLEMITEVWRPYRSIASLVLWRSVD